MRIACVLWVASLAATADDVPTPPAFEVPRTLGAWEARRNEVATTIRRLLGGLPARPTPDRVEASADREQDGFLVRDLTIHSAKLGSVPAVFCRPAGSSS